MFSTNPSSNIRLTILEIVRKNPPQQKIETDCILNYIDITFCC